VAASSHKLWSARWARMRAAYGRTLPAPCIACGELVLPSEPWHLGHKVPRALGGQDVPDNLGPSHVRCNLSEAASIAWRKKQLGIGRTAPPSRDWYGDDPSPTEPPEEVEPSRIW
jgi:HNH endonuclease